MIVNLHCSEPGGGVAVAIVAFRAPGRLGGNEMKQLAIFICLCFVTLLPSCKSQQQTHSRILQLYSQISTGMSQQEAEKILGPPLFPAMHQTEIRLLPPDAHPEGDVCWY